MKTDGVMVTLLLFVAVAVSVVFILWMGLLSSSSGWVLVPGIVMGAALFVGAVLMWRIVIKAFEYFD